VNRAACARFNAGARPSLISTVSFQLRDNLHWCDCEGRAVFLDMEADRYFCLPKAANEAFLRLAAASSQSGDSEALQPLLARGLLTEAGGQTSIPPPPLIEAPIRDFTEQPVLRPSALSILRALAAELSTARALRTRPFQAVVEAARSREPASAPIRPGSARSIGEIVSAAAVISFLTRSHDRCLVRALALHSMCRTNGFDPKLVFGVIAHPFAAHCWVQLGNDVLIGGYEQARLYTPILVVE
jgi:hypothetical protein